LRKAFAFSLARRRSKWVAPRRTKAKESENATSAEQPAGEAGCGVADGRDCLHDRA
jgi:hypothetical protein